MRTVPLNESVPVTLDLSGNGTAQIGPGEPAAVWHPTVVHVDVNTNVSEASATIYAGPAPVQSYFVDSTQTASSGDSSDRITGKVISRTQLPYIWAVFTGGDPGATAVLNITGTKDIP